MGQIHGRERGTSVPSNDVSEIPGRGFERSKYLNLSLILRRGASGAEVVVSCHGFYLFTLPATIAQ